MKRSLSALLVSLAAAAALPLSIGACGSDSKDDDDKAYNTKIADYLYAVEYDDFDFDKAVKAIDEKYMPKAACSEVRKGDFIGRNLDWYINKEASSIIKVNAKKDVRFASLGMGGSNPAFTNELAASQKYSDAYLALPATTTDGINEKGLYIGVNVMPTGETSMDKSTWKDGAWGMSAAYTNPGADKTYCVTLLTRVVLDKADSVDSAKEIIKGINWYDPMNFPSKDHTQAFHWLISDSNKSVVLEFIDNQPVFTETKEVSAPSYATIMTNFTNHLMDQKEGAGQIIQDHGAGYERWDILKRAYPAAEESFDGIEQMMKSVWYSNTYTKAAKDPDFFLSEYASAERPASTLYNHPEVWDDEAFLETVKKAHANYDDKSQWHTDSTSLWYTTHTSMYQLSTRTLKVLVHEGMDQQKEFYTVSFDDHFEKPLK